MGGNTSCHELKSKCDAGDEESCKNLHANCQCFLANNKNVVEEVHSTGFHLLELHNNSAGIGILYFLAFGGLIALIFLIYMKCKRTPNTWSQQNHSRWYSPITHNPAIAYERPTTIPNIKIVDITDDDDIKRQLSNQTLRNLYH